MESSRTIYQQWGLREVINARGYNTALGSAIMPREVREAMMAASTSHVLMSELGDYAAKVIARVTGAESGCVTSGAAAGVAISIAACLTGADITRIEQLPDVSTFPRNEVIVQRGHMTRFQLMVSMTGARIVPFGYIGGVGWTTEEQLRGSITERTAAVFHVLGEHAHHQGELGLSRVIEVAYERGVPVVVDAAGMTDLRACVALGVDLVTHSGGKCILGPGSSGLIAGRAEVINACRRQEWGIARPMKVSKEEVVGLITALERYERLDHRKVWREWHDRCTELARHFAAIPHVRVHVLDQNDAGEPAAFVELTIDEAALGRSAREINDALASGNPAIRVRDYLADVGVLQLDVRTLLPEQEAVLVSRIKQELAP